MRLKELEIQGFKSFPDKTKITIGEGITGVVGPNGSGKSNISDSIRWNRSEWRHWPRLRRMRVLRRF